MKLWKNEIIHQNIQFTPYKLKTFIRICKIITIPIYYMILFFLGCGDLKPLSLPAANKIATEM